MGESTIIEWLDENSYRAYPLMPGGSTMVKIRGVNYDVASMIVDANLVYQSLPAHVSLLSVSTADTAITITVTGQPTFTGSLSGDYPVYMRNSVGSLLVLGYAAKQLLGTTTALSFTDVEFESSVAIELSNVILGVTRLVVDTVSLTNDVVFGDGYQLSLMANGNTIQMEAGRNEGKPLPCGNFKGTVSDCGSVTSNINGACPVNNGGPVNLLAGSHVKIFDDPTNHRIYIGLDFQAADVNDQKLLPPI